MNKVLLFEKLKSEIEKNLQLALTAAQNTYSDATHPDSKAENKYDTRGLEASYLAGAQAERVVDLRETLGSIHVMQIKKFTADDKIALSAVLHIENETKDMWAVLLGKGGGQSFEYEGKKIHVLTPDSPIGKELIGRFEGDTFLLNGKEYEISEVF